MHISRTQRTVAERQSPPRNFAAGVRYQTEVFYLLVLVLIASAFGISLLKWLSHSDCGLSISLLISDQRLSILLLVVSVRESFSLASSHPTNIQRDLFPSLANTQTAFL